ncbi:MAG: DUF3426 domain-containing protein [Desulfatiglandales bacterium]
MIITCENCDTSFNLDEKMLKPSGSKVRCSKCKHLFVAYPPVPPEPEKEISEKAAPAETPEETAAGETATPDLQPKKDQEDMAPETVAAGEIDEFPPDEPEPVSDERDKDVSGGFDVELDIDTVAEDRDTLEGETPESREEGPDLPEIEEAPLGEAEAAPAEEKPFESLDMDLDLEMESEPEAVEDADAAEDVESEELDFSDFEETVMLDSPPASDIEMKSEEKTEDFDLDLDLNLEMEEESEVVPEPDMPSVAKEGDAGLEDLDLEMELEMESGDDESGEVLKEDQAEDIDLSDIEKMLDEDDEVAANVMETPSEKDDVEAEVEKWKQQPIHDDSMDETAEIDLSNIVLDTEDVEEEEAEDVELQLDINEEPSKKEAGAFSESRKDASDIDISDFEDFEIPDEQASAGEDFAGGDIELEFEMEGEKTPVGMPAFDRDSETETVAFATPFIESGDKPEEATAEKKSKKIKTRRKSSTTKPILIVLILFALAFAAVIILDRIDIKIPVVSDYLKQLPYINQLMKPEAVQFGEISISNISSQFVENSKHGKLFVIRGTATNDFPESRRYIQLTGTLYQSGKTVVKQESVYCGNVLSDLRLADMDLAEINTVVSNRFGDRKTNFEVKPGQEIPFMIVFSDLPNNLEEFAVEVAGSDPIQQQ